MRWPLTGGEVLRGGSELTDAGEVTRAAIVVVTHDRQMRDDLAHRPTLALPGRSA